MFHEVSFILSGAIPLKRGAFGDDDLPTFLSGVSCSGVEDKLLECLSNENPFPTCGTYNDAAVVCQSKSSLIFIIFIRVTIVGQFLDYAIINLIQISQSLITALLEKLSSYE